MFSSTLTESEEFKKSAKKSEEITAGADEPVKLPAQYAEQPLIWRNVIGLFVMHVAAVYFFILSGPRAMLRTYIFGTLYGIITGYGVTAGAHRLWAHRSYSAKTPLKILLAILYCGCGMTCFFSWIRDHRTHHRYTETPADPHDANRGFFFSHVGWLMMRRHPAVKEYGSKVDMSDIYGDPVLQFFNKYYTPIMLFLCFVLPSVIPVYFWNEKWDVSMHAVFIRYIWLLNATFSVNSFAHMWGNRPYNGNVKPTENPTVSFFALGEGWHNYHHSFPWDYKAAELGGYFLNTTTCFIELMAFLGLAYNLKTPSKSIVEKVSINKGDGTDSLYGNHYNHYEQDHHHHHHHHHHHNKLQNHEDYQDIRSR